MVSRRDFLKIAGSAAGTAAVTLAGGEACASSLHLDPDRIGVLTDFTLCIGCRRCEWACAQQNELPFGPLESCDDQSVFEEMRRPDAERFTVVNRYEPSPGQDKPFHTKLQCMHCEHAPCVSACVVGALEKNPLGPVVYDAWKCIGCRYCMIACPYQIPAYEYDNALTPMVMKCNLCEGRTVGENQKPACVEICPQEAMVFGKRSDLLALAHERIRTEPGRYHPEIYGEHTAGGSSFMFLADRPFTELDLPALSDESPAEVTENIQHGIFRGFTGPLMVFGLLSVLMKSAGDKRKDKEDSDA